MKVKNLSDKTLAKVVVRFHYFDDNGKELASEDFNIINALGEDKTTEPLKPGYIDMPKIGEYFRSSVDIPNWKTNKYRYEIVKVEFSKALKPTLTLYKFIVLIE